MTRVLIGVVLAASLLTACSDSRTPSTQAASSSGGPTTTTTTTATTTTAVSDPQYSPGRHDVSFDVNGVTRTAVLVVPTDLSHPAPLVFAFHGHGGNGAAFDRRIDIDGLWPEAIVIYPDGLPGHKGITDPEGALPGWQVRPGDEGDRDLAFYDTMLSTLQAKLPVDDARIYVMGHSNGSAFTALLLGLRGTAIAATATMSGQPAKILLDVAPPRSMFLMMGRADPLVPFEQQQQAIPLAEAKLGVDPTTATTDGYLTSERGSNGLELETYVHPGGHDVPPEVPPLVVQFFQRHTLPLTGR